MTRPKREDCDYLIVKLYPGGLENATCELNDKQCPYYFQNKVEECEYANKEAGTGQPAVKD